MRIETVAIDSKIDRRIAVLSDLHNSPKWRDIVIPKVDLILIPGDLVKSYGYGWDNAYEFLKYAQSIAQVFYSVGNHECLSPVEWHELVKGLGVVYLNNQTVEYQDMIIGGIQDSHRLTSEWAKCRKYKGFWLAHS